MFDVFLMLLCCFTTCICSLGKAVIQACVGARAPVRTSWLKTCLVGSTVPKEPYEEVGSTRGDVWLTLVT